MTRLAGAGHASDPRLPDVQRDRPKVSEVLGPLLRGLDTAAVVLSGLDCNEVCNVYCRLGLIGGQPQPAAGTLKLHGISLSIRDYGCPFAMASSLAFMQTT